MSTITWKGLTGDWITPSDWVDGSVPLSTDDVLFDTGGSYTATISTDVLAASLTFSDGATLIENGSASLTLTGALTLTLGTLQLDGTTSVASFAQSGGLLTGGGLVTIEGSANFTDNNGNVEERGTGTTDLKAGGTLSGTANLILDGGRVLENEGALAWQSGNIILSSAGMDNAAGATFDAQSDTRLVAFTDGTTFTNVGTFTKSGGTGATEIDSAFDNTGTVDVGSGTLSLNGGGTSSGDVSIASAATLNFGAGTFSITGGTINSQGTFQVSNGRVVITPDLDITGQVKVVLGALELDGITTIASLTQSGGALTGTGLVTIEGSANFTDNNGNVEESGTGTTDLKAGGTLSGTGNLIVDGGRVLENEGAFAWQSGNIILSSAGIDNVAGATFDAQGDARLSAFTDGTTFINAGTFTKSGGTGATAIDSAFDNTGTVDVESGTLTLDGGGTSSGNFSIASGATLNFAANQAGISYLITGGSIAGAGLTTLTNCLLEIDGATTIDTFAQAGGVLTGSAVVTITEGQFTDNNGNIEESGSGTTDLKGGGTLSGTANLILDGTRVFENEGSFAWQSGNILLGPNASIDNAAGATFDDQTDGNISAFVGGATVVNAGTFTKSAGTGTTQIQSAFDNTGTVEVDSGTLDITGPLSGSGQLVINGPGAVLELNGGGDSGSNFNNAITGNVTFGAGLGTLRLDSPFSFRGTINGFADGDVIDIANQKLTSAFGNGDFLDLVLSNGGSLRYAMPGAQDLHFVLRDDGHGGTDVLFDHFGVTPRISVAGPLVVQPFMESPDFLAGVGITDANAVVDNEIIEVDLSLSGLTFQNTRVDPYRSLAAADADQPSTVVLRGTLDQVNAELASIDAFPVIYETLQNGEAFLHPLLTFAQVDIRVSDGVDGTGFASLPLSINAPPNLRPLAILDSVGVPVPTADATSSTPFASLVQEGVSYAIGPPPPFPDQWVVDADVDTGAGPTGFDETFTVTVTDTIGILTANADGPGGGGSIRGSGTNQLIVIGTEFEVNADLATVTYTAASLGDDTITIGADDGRGGGASSGAHATISVSVGPPVVNAPPVIEGPFFELIQTGIAASISDFSIADDDGAGEAFTVTLTEHDHVGVLAANITAPGGGGTITPAPDGYTLTISGTLAQVNADLTTLTVSASAADLFDTLQIQASDGRGGTDSQVHDLIINAPPVATVPTTQNTLTNESLPIPGIQVSDADGDGGLFFDITLQTHGGLLSATGGPDVTITSGTSQTVTSGTTQLEMSGPLDQLNTALTTLSYISSVSGTDTIDVTTTDGHAGQTTQHFDVDVNAKPVITFAGSQVIQQGISARLGATVTEFAGSVTTAISGGDGISIADDDATAAGETIKVTLSDPLGVLSATTNAQGGGGTITGSSTSLLTIRGTLAQVDADLSTLDYRADVPGVHTLNVVATDDRGGSSNLSLPLIVNAPPVATTPDTPTLVTANQFSPLPVFQVSDVDSAGETITAHLQTNATALSANTGGSGGGGTISGNQTAALTISGTLAQVNADLLTLAWSTSPGGGTVTMFATDDRGGSSPLVTFDKPIVNLPPVTTVPASATVSQNASTTISGISVVDPDGAQEQFSVTLTALPNDGTLSATTHVAGGGGTIRGSGTAKLVISGSLAQVNADLKSLTYFNRSFGTDTIDVQTSDGRGGRDDHQIAVTIAPHISLVPPKLIKGYISGATVFADDNRNGVLDPGEFSAVTDSTGGFTLAGGTGPLVAFGGTDVSTGLPFLGELSAPADSTVVTPLTTLLDLLEQQNVGDAEAALLGSLGLAPGLDLETLDPIAAAQGGDLVGGAAEVAAAKVYDTVSMIASTLSGAGASFTAAEHDAFAAIADAIAGPGLNLSDPTALTALIDGIAQSEGVTLSSAMAGDVATILSAGNAALDHVAQTDTAGANLLVDTAGIETRIQGSASSAFAQAAGDATKVDSFAFQFTSADGVTLGAVAGQRAVVLTGTPGDDVLVGSRTADNIIEGKAGNDILTGGAGNDALVFNFDVAQQTEIQYVPVTQRHHDFVSLANVTSIVVDDTTYYKPALTAALTAWRTWDTALTAYANSRPDNTGGDDFIAFTNANPGRGRGGTVGTIQLVDGYYHDYDTTTLQKQTVTVTTVTGDGFDTITNFANPSLTVANGGAGTDTLLFKGLSADATAANYWGDWLDSTSSGGNTTIHVHDVVNHGADVAAITLAGVTTDVGTLVHQGGIVFAAS